MLVSDKEPAVAKEEVKDKKEGCYESYSITANSGYVEELSLNDIIFIRNKLSEFINEKKGGKK